MRHIVLVGERRYADASKQRDLLLCAPVASVPVCLVILTTTIRLLVQQTCVSNV